ncbi:cadherin-like beta sandwich domain-containing protein [Paenibacillus sp. PAMC21692]|uniref:cadherin-like beta sandwich domain-containing protein n=1 Tax=Paenibacillus sp. PAMC21692 TaxID=2762320 RepID=UPI00164E14BC|nr:cadherin-like beta sandwich domain-containing protein [Paenibacillus sp. PAMC21692]QNK60129.1 cadherin-like beta sandwich domain-containing protein [Paenibacillus sp. PAMC21692]
MEHNVANSLRRLHSSKLLVRFLVLLLMLSLIPIYPTVEAESYVEELPAEECTNSQAAWIFCDDFEQDRFNQYYIHQTSAKLFREDGTGLGESKGLTANFQGSYPTAGNLSLAFGKTPNALTYNPVGNPDEVVKDFYFRTYVKNDETWAGGENGRFLNFYAYGPNNLVIAKASVEYSSGTLYAFLYGAKFDENGNPVGLDSSSYTTTASKILGAGVSNQTWHEVQVHIKLNDPGQSNGVYQVWIDGDMETNKTNMNWIGSYADYGFNVVEFSNYVSVQNVPLQSRHYDNIVLSSDFIESVNLEAGPPSNLVFEDNFDSYTDSPRNHGWGEVHSAVVIDPVGGKNGSHAAKVQYTTPEQVVMLRNDVSNYDLNQVFVSFDFKLDSPVDNDPSTKGGSKFLKLFGKDGLNPNGADGVANTTFGLEYTTNKLIEVSYGKGTDLNNDTQTTIGYNGNHIDSLVNIRYSTDTFVPQTNQWHSFKAFMKYNSNGNRDGEYIVWIDGELRLYATNVTNRNVLNSDEFKYVSLGDYSRVNADHPWNLWYDNVQIMREVPEELAAGLSGNNANLSALTVNTGTLSPTFSKEISNYTLELPAGATSLDITPTTEQNTATIQVNGASLSNKAAVTVPVGVNATKVNIVVTAMDGVTAKTYTISIKRPSVVAECGFPREGWIFCDDFESDRLDKYYDYFKRWGRFQREGKGIEGSTGMVSYYGNYSADTGVIGPYGTWMKLAFGKTPDPSYYKPAGDPEKIEKELYWRFYVRNNTIAEGNTAISNGPLARVYGYGPDGIPIMQINVNYPDSSGVLVSELLRGQFDQEGLPTGTTEAAVISGTEPIMHPGEAGQWRLIEIHARLNDPGQSNGVYELRIDGQLEASKTDLDWVGSYTDYGINAVELYNTNNQPGVPGGDLEYRAFDNMVLSRSPIGAPGAVSQINANLSNITASVGKLSPHFQANATTYTLTLEHGATSVDITPVAADEQATVKVNDEALPSGNAFTLSGAAQAVIKVTARDGSTSKAYTVTLAQAAPFEVNECSAAHADWLFCDDYEVDRMDQYFERTSRSQFYRTSDVGLSGSSGMKAEFRQADGAEHDTGAIKVAFGRTPTSYMDPVAAENEDLTEVYFRFYVKHQEGWIGGGGDKLARLSSMQSANWAQSMIAHVWSGNNAGKNLLVAEPARGTDASGTLLSTKWNDWANLYWFGGQASETPIYDENHVGEWYSVETRVKLNDPGQSNGIFQVWIDDKLQMNRTDLNWIGSYEIGPGKGYGLNWLALENYWNAGTPQDQERYFDNFVISRSKIGLATAEATDKPIALLSGDSDVKLASENIEMTVSVEDLDDAFTVADFIVNYDPQKLEFATETNGNSVVLADSAIESLLPNFSIASAVKQNQGEIRVIMMAAGEQNAVNGSRPIIKLHGTVKNTAETGSTAVSLSDFEISMNGEGTLLDVSDASLSIQVVQSNKAALSTLIANVQQTRNAAVVGSQPGQYPQSSVNALSAAIQSATAVLENATAAQTDIDNAVIALNAALSTFTSSVNGSVSANLTALNAAITAAESKYAKSVEGSKIGQYAPASKAALQTAINAAKAVRDNASSSQVQVDQAAAALNQASAAFSSTMITLTPNAGRITIHDLSIIAKYFGAKSTDANWTEIEKADLLGQGEITIEVLAAVAQMILDDWLAD